MSEAKKVIMLGNEAIARGAYEAGVKVSAAYPGTPSTEISENLVKYKDDLYCEWSPNEKVATEVAIGASVAGVRAMSCMKPVSYTHLDVYKRQEIHRLHLPHRWLHFISRFR